MSDTHRIVLTEDMTIYNAASQRQCIVDAIAARDSLELDLSHVPDMDSAGLQLLILFKRETQRLGKQGRIVGHSPVVQEVIDFVNLAAWLDDPMVMPPAAG